MRSRILSLWLPNLPTDRLRRRSAADRHEVRAADRGAPARTAPARAPIPSSTHGISGVAGRGSGLVRAGGSKVPSDASTAAANPLATFVNDRGALRLAAVCPSARRLGLVPGLMLADARARVPDLEVEPARPEADARLLDEIAVWCERYTPMVAVDRSHEGDEGGALWLDITGCAHLFGGEATLRDDLLGRLKRQGFDARAAIADHPGTAWAVARHGPGQRQIVPPGGARTALAALPVVALRLPPEVVAMLERLGLGHIEDLHPLPRQALAARFGTILLTRLEQALGRVAEPISPRSPRPAHRAQLTFVEPLLEGQALLPPLRRLLHELSAGLEAAGLGARRLTLACYRVDGSTASVAIGTSRPCRAVTQLLRLLDEKLTSLDPGFGIERLILEAPVVEPLLPEPLAWRAMGAGDLDQVRDLAPLVDRLSNRLGEGAVTQLVPRESHVPERAQERIPALGCEKPLPFPVRPKHGEGPSRPLRLLARPEPIEAMAPLPDEPPVLFRWRRMLHQVVRVSGPERLAPEWWRRPELDPDQATRDYFAVEDSAGGRFWLFREGLYGAATPTLPRWYLHGLFA